MSMGRLEQAIELAEHEVDTATTRAQEVQRTILRQKDQELAELQRLTIAKERAAEALQEQMNGLRSSYEKKLAAVESVLCQKDSEASALRAELLALQAERDDLRQRLRDSDEAAAGVEADAADQAEALGARIQAQGRELEQAVAACHTERRDKELLQIEVQELKRELDAATAEARTARAKAAGALEQCRTEGEACRDLAAELEDARAQLAFLKETKEIEVAELRRRLRAERGVRKACERWLRTELRSREEMEALMVAVRDAAFGRPLRRDGQQVQQLVETLIAGLGEASGRNVVGGGGGGVDEAGGWLLRSAGAPAHGAPSSSGAARVGGSGGNTFHRRSGVAAAHAAVSRTACGRPSGHAAAHGSRGNCGGGGGLEGAEADACMRNSSS